MHKRTVRSTSSGAPHGASKNPRSRFGIIAGCALAAALVAPFFVWGNPYPPQILRYWAGGTVVAALVAVVFFKWYDEIVRPVGEAISRLTPLAFSLLVAAATTAASAIMAVFVFHRFATTSDEIAQLWHARILLTGRLSLPVDPNPEFFSLDTVVDSGRWYSQFPIGGPLVLAVGALVGAPWIINPLLAGGAAAAIYSFARRAYGESDARWASGLFSVSPMVLLMAGTWMNHVPVLLVAAIMLVALAAWDAATAMRASVIAAAILGIAIGGMATIRPLDAVVAAVVVGAFQLWSLRSDRRRAVSLLAQVATGICCIGVLLFVNWKTTGSPTRFGYDVAWGPGHRVGFHPDPYGNPHTPLLGLDYALSYLGELNIYLTTWPVPVLIVLVVALCAMRRPARWDVLLLAYLVAQTVAYGGYWYRGELFGPRFLYTVLPAFIILIARAPALFTERFGERARRGAVAGIVACTLVAWVAPSSTVAARGIATQASGQRRSLKADITGAVRDAQLHHALVFLREPFSLRLGRRLWALGIPRGEAPSMLATHDACQLLTAIRTAERDTGATLEQKAAMIRMVPVVVNATGTVPTDPAIHVASRATLTPECNAEIEGDSGRSPVPFGTALVLEPIDGTGHIGGDVVYVADLGDHNEALRGRFGDRAWYRARIVPTTGVPPVVIDRY